MLILQYSMSAAATSSRNHQHGNGRKRPRRPAVAADASVLAHDNGVFVTDEATSPVAAAATTTTAPPLLLTTSIAQLPDNQAQRARHLLGRLKQELRKLGHNGYVREDSQLAISFVCNRLDRSKWNLRSVATEIYKTSRLYEATNFGDVSRCIVEEAARGCAQLVDPHDFAVVRRTAIHFLVPALKNVYTQLFSLMDAKIEQEQLLQQQHQQHEHEDYDEDTQVYHQAVGCIPPSAMVGESNPDLIIEFGDDDDYDEVCSCPSDGSVS